MAKKIESYIKLQVSAAEANPSPPVGPALGQHGLNIMDFCKAFNAQTQDLDKGMPVPVIITVYNDRSFTFITKTPPAAVLLRKVTGIEKGSGEPHMNKVGTVTRAQLEEVANIKMKDLNANDIDAAVQIVAGTARSMGLVFSIADALSLVKDCATAKFDESIDVSINLGIDSKKSDQNVRGAVVLPNGTGKIVRVAVFTQGENVQKATDAGADVVGMEDLMKSMQDGNLNYDVVIASPDTMSVVGRLGQILGPRGLMPNPKVGTVTTDVAKAVKNAKAGQVRYRADKAGIVHAGVGKASFDVKALEENIAALIDALKKAKPSSAKGVYFKKISISSTMGPGLAIDAASFDI